MKKRSRQREAIIRVLKETSTHPTAEWIHAEVKKQLPNVGIATVYRNLRLLSNTGDISEIATPSGTNRFDARTKSHHHFRCDCCGAILDVDEPIDRQVEERISRTTGLKVNGHHLEFRGLCVTCQRP